MTGSELLTCLLALGPEKLLLRVDEMDGGGFYHLRLPPSYECRSLPSSWFSVDRHAPVSPTLEALLVDVVKRAITSRGLSVSTHAHPSGTVEAGTHELDNPVEPTGICRADGVGELHALLRVFSETDVHDFWPEVV